jgi:pimeloyl-ACP methyl ester carboxylesterase
MGGMIAQSFAIAFPQKTRTLTSIMSTTGDPAVGQPSAEALGALLGPAPTTRDEAIENRVRLQKVIGSPGYPFDETVLRADAAATYDRSFHPVGMVRQVAAVVSQPDRTAALHDVSVPTLVIHGADDPLVDPSGGRATADAVPGATLKIVPGMGHDIPPELFEETIDALAENFARA